MGIRMTGSESGIGAAVQRKEDGRFMRRLGRYVADIDLPGMLEVCFARSPVAHARIGAIEGPQHRRYHPLKTALSTEIRNAARPANPGNGRLYFPYLRAAV